MECDNTELHPCHCLICAGQRIGDQVMDDRSAHRRKQ
jgi:hypothetical protein